jgi:hypothetical protein
VSPYSIPYSPQSVFNHASEVNVEGQQLIIRSCAGCSTGYKHLPSISTLLHLCLRKVRLPQFAALHAESALRHLPYCYQDERALHNIPLNWLISMLLMYGSHQANDGLCADCSGQIRIRSRVTDVCCPLAS